MLSYNVENFAMLESHLVMGVYVISEGTPQKLEQVRCKDEDRELQTVLERNPNLLPGDQIKPGDPRRWLIVKREMPVPDRLDTLRKRAGGESLSKLLKKK
jgi:hypothetical protein